ncbi:MAG: SRPBCC domain-containing protein [Cyanobacteria bacterium J06635_15]
MKTYSVTQTINADAAIIWSILIDGSKYPEWNESVEKIDGNIGPNEAITVHAKNSQQAFPVKVVEFVPSQKMVWRGGMPLGLFTGTRTFTLSSDRGESVEFHMQEDFTGLMAPLITRSIPDLTPAFEQFAMGLKHKAESAP